MPFRTWMYIFALGLGLAGSLQAQEQAYSADSPATSQSDPPDSLPLSIPVRIIEDSVTTDARDHSEKERTQREKDDLVAQQGMNTATQAMNEATQSMVRAAWVSTGLVGLGTILLIWTLRITREANASARAAVDVTREMGIHQVRAYVSTYTPRVSNFKVGEIAKFEIDFRNFGQSPARIVVAVIAVKWGHGPESVKFLNMVAGDRPRTGALLSAGGEKTDTLHMGEPLTAKMYSDVISGISFVTFGGFIIYKDVFNITRRQVFRTYLDNRSIVEGVGRFRTANKNNRST